MSKAKSFLIGVMALPSCRSAAGRPEARQHLKSGATGPSSQQALGKEASSSCRSSRRAHTEPRMATSPTATIPYRRPPTTTSASTAAPRLERPHRRYVRILTLLLGASLALTSPAWSQDDWTVMLTGCSASGIDDPLVTMSGTITAHKALPNVVVKGYANDDLIGSDSIGDMEADESEDFSISGSYTGSAVGLLCRAEVTVTFPPDLVIESFAISYDILAPGESFTLIAYVGNKGDIASGGTTLRWYQSTDETITSSDTELGTEAVGGLLGSQTVRREIDLTAPASTL